MATKSPLDWWLSYGRGRSSSQLNMAKVAGMFLADDLISDCHKPPLVFVNYTIDASCAICNSIHT